MIRGIKTLVRDKTLFRMENGILRPVGKPMDMVRKLPPEIKILHIVDLNAKDGNTTNFDLYDHMTYKLNIEVEIAPKEELVKKLLRLKTRAVLELPCALDLNKFKSEKRLLVGKVQGRGRSEYVHDYYVESEDLDFVKNLTKEGKRVLLYSKTIDEKEAEKAGVFTLIND